MDHAYIPLVSSGVAVLIAIGGGFLSWYHNDTQSKVRFEFVKDTVKKLEEKHDVDIESYDERISNLEKENISSMADRQEIHRDLVRLENTKASKEVADNFRSDIIILRQDIDKRFDRIERLLEKVTLPLKGKQSSDS